MELDNKSKEIIKVIEDNDWSVQTISDNEFEIENWSPAGEDLVDYVDYDGTPESVAKSIKELYECFDVDEHVEMWIGGRGKRGVPETARELVEDAEAIKEMYEKLYRAVSKLI